MSEVETVTTIVLGAAAAPVVAAWAYLAALSVAALARGKRRQPRPGTRSRLSVLIPAHDEAGSIATTVRSLLGQSYPAGLFSVLVIADNCSDSTASEAAAAGATVVERHDGALKGKGHALRWAMDRLLAAPDAPDGIVVVDADTEADEGLLEALAGALESGAQAAQADYTIAFDQGAGVGDRLRAMAVLLFNRARNLGRDTMGLPAALLGNGMLLSRELLVNHPWNAFSPAEDLEFATRCRISGVRPVFVASQGVRGTMPTGYAAAVGQRTRWEGGRFWVARRLGGALAASFVRNPDRGRLDALFDLFVPPLSILVPVTVAGLALGLAAALAAAAAPAVPAAWALAAALAGVHVLGGLKAAGAPRSGYQALVALPGFLAWKLGVYVHLRERFDPNRWDRSVRGSEREWR